MRRSAARRSAGTRSRWRSSAIVFLVALTYAFTRVFSGRGAFTQIGALIGTIMVANVFVDDHSQPEEDRRRAARRQGRPIPLWARSASSARSTTII